MISYNNFVDFVCFVQVINLGLFWITQGCGSFIHILVFCNALLMQDSYCVPRVTTLRLKKTSLGSVDSNILDYRGFYVFRKTGTLQICVHALVVLALSHGGGVLLF